MNSLNKIVVNPYSVGIVGAFILSFLIVFSIGAINDRNDNKSLSYMRSPDYDLLQYYVIKFRREKFSNKIGFLNLYCYLVKNLHPILSILSVYDPVYNRKLRTMDFFLNIYLTFFFTLLPFYITENSQLVDLAANRSIQNRNKKINDLEASIKQILQGVIYSVIASVATQFINIFVNLFLYQNVLLKEGEKRKKYTLNALVKVNPKLVASRHQIKLKKAFLKLRTILTIIERYLRKIRENEEESIRSKRGIKYSFSSINYGNPDRKKIRKILTGIKHVGESSESLLALLKKSPSVKNKSIKNLQLNSSSLTIKTEIDSYRKNDDHIDHLKSNEYLKGFEKQQKNLKTINDLNNIRSQDFSSDILVKSSSSAAPDTFEYKQASFAKNVVDSSKKNLLFIQEELVKKPLDDKNIYDIHCTSENNGDNKNNNNKNNNFEEDAINKKMSSRNNNKNKKNIKFNNKNKTSKENNNILKNESFSLIKNSNWNLLQNSSRKYLIDNYKLDAESIYLEDNLIVYEKIYHNDKSKFKNRRYNYSYLKGSLETQVFLKGNQEIILKPKKMYLSIQTRTFNFPCKDSSIFYCQKISITNISRHQNIINELKSNFKIFSVGIIYVFLWIYIAVFVESIFKQYGKNIIKICVMPLISMLFTKLVIVVNIMLFLTTTVLYFKGKGYVNNSKNNLIDTLIFKALVPPLAMNHFSAILTYQDFILLKNKD